LFYKIGSKKATRFGLVVRDFGNIQEVLGSILIGNIVKKIKMEAILPSERKANT
jgi:hypothetical protein